MNAWTVEYVVTVPVPTKSEDLTVTVHPASLQALVAHAKVMTMCSP